MLKRNTLVRLLEAMFPQKFAIFGKQLHILRNCWAALATIAARHEEDTKADSCPLTNKTPSIQSVDFGCSYWDFPRLGCSAPHAESMFLPPLTIKQRTKVSLRLYMTNEMAVCFRKFMLMLYFCISWSFVWWCLVPAFSGLGITQPLVPRISFHRWMGTSLQTFPQFLQGLMNQTFSVNYHPFCRSCEMHFKCT